jgi:predicted DNA-binding transcriptional regulator
VEATFPVSSGLLEAKHVEAIGAAVWVFLVLVDWQTGDDGLVARGEVIQSQAIAARLGVSDRAVRYHLTTLEAGEYIRRELVQQGWRIWIAKPKRHPQPRKNFSATAEESCRPARKKVADLRGKIFPQPRKKVADLAEAQLPAEEICRPDSRVIRAEESYLSSGFGKNKKETDTPLPPSIDWESELARLKAAYPKDALVNAQITESAWVDAVLSTPNPAAVLAEVWAGLARMKASGTQVRYMPMLKDFLLNGRFRERWPREDQNEAEGRPVNVSEVMRNLRAKREIGKS